MKIPITKYAQALALVLMDEKDRKRIDGKIQNFLKLLVKRREAKMIKRFMPEFKTVWLKMKGQLEVKATLPYEPSDQEKSDLVNSLGDALKKEVILNVCVDEKVIGGMKLEFEDYVIDGTILKNLEMLKYNLINYGN